MKLGKVAALAASALTLGALTIGTATPANAQGWHHGGEYRHGFAPVYHRELAPNYRHFRGAVSPRYVAPVYHQGPRFYHRRYPVVTEWTPGPGYVRHSWAWYNSQPGYWRAAHPYRYHGSPSLGIWIRL